MSLFEDRVEYAVKYLYQHSDPFVRDFTAIYNNDQGDLLVQRGQDAFTRAGGEILGCHPDEWTWEFPDQYAVRTDCLLR